jgi:hypothetical protein
MSPELAAHLVSPMIEKHPIPWRWEEDWTIEIYDAKGILVTKLMNLAQAEELIAFATELAESEAVGAAEAKKLLAEVGINLD